MLKKLVYLMAASVMLFATSCETDADVAPKAGKTSVVTFSVGTPEIVSRAYSDGLTATVLQYAVYDEDGELLPELTVNNGEIHGSTTVNLKLTTGKEYSVIFWAAAPDAPYTVDFEEKTMTVDYTGALSNDENRDAFYNYHTFTVKGTQTETIELKRPFAQLNVGTSDYVDAAKAGYVPTKSAVTVRNICNTLNFADGTVSGNAEVTFDYNTIPVGENFPVQGYEYLSMNYLLVAAQKSLVEIEFGYTETDANDAMTRTVGSVPVQRNYRTNIFGQLFTSDVAINVEIVPEYEEPDYEVSALYLAAAVGGEVTLTENVVLTQPLNIQANMTVNLNGKTISADCHKSVGAVINVAEGVSFNLSNGTVSSTGNNGGSAIDNKGTAVLEDVTLNGAPNADGSWPSYTVNNTGNLTVTNANITSYHGAVASYGSGAIVTLNNTNIDMTGIAGFTSHAIYTYNDGTVEVNGGNIANNATDQASTGASVINGAVTINAGTFTGRIENYYGTPVLNGGSYSVKPNANFVAAGKTAIENGGRYYVVDEGVADAATVANVTTITESTADVATALATNNGEVTMFVWNDVAYIAKYGEVVIASSADEATTVRGIVEGTSLTNATVKEGIEVVGNRTFRKCANLTTVELPNTLTEIGPAVFQSCGKLANVTIPASVTTIGEGAFAECTSLTSINIPDGITRLEKDVLRNTGLVSIEIPASVNYIGTYAFRDCESLTEVKILSPEFTIENNSFSNMAAPVPTMTIYVVNAEMKAYLDSTLTNYDKSYITVVVM